LKNNSYSIYPINIESQSSLLHFLGSDKFLPNMQHSDRLKIIQNSIYNYIKINNLYSTLSAIVLDINLLSDFPQDKSGLLFMENFRNSNELELPEQYKQWNKIIPIVALTKYPIGKYRSEFMKYPGYLAQVFNKDDVINNHSDFFDTINNFHEQMSATYSLFYAPELKDILRQVNQNTKQLEELEQISKLLLWSNIALMDIEKRNIFMNYFPNELIKYAKENDAFMDNIENSENSFKNAIQKIFNSTPITILEIFSLFGATINIDKIPDVIAKANELVYNFLN